LDLCGTLWGFTTDDRQKTREQLLQELAVLRQRVASLEAAGTAPQHMQEALSTRARQQAAVATLGQRALEGLELATLLDEVVVCSADTLGVEYCTVLELLPDDRTLLLRAGVGWHAGLVGVATVELGTPSQASYTLLANAPVIVDDLRTETRFSGPPLLHDHGVRSGLSVLIHGVQRPFGVLGVHTARQRPFSTDDQHFLQAVANVLAEAIRRQRSEAVLATRLRQIDAVRAVTTEITRELHLPTLLTLIVQRAVTLVGVAQAGTIYLWDEAQQALTPQAWHGIGEWVGEVSIRPGEGLTGVVAQRRQGLRGDDYTRSPYAHPLWQERLGTVAVMAEPLLYRERLIGVIIIGHARHRRPFSAEDQHLLTLFAAQAAIAIENARLFEENDRRQARLRGVLDINTRIAASEDMTSLLRHIAAEAAQLVGADGARVRRRQENRLVLLAEADYGAAIAWTSDVSLEEGMAGRVVRENRPMIVPDIQTAPDILPAYNGSSPLNQGGRSDIRFGS